MTGEDFIRELDRLGLTQAAFARLVGRLSGHELGHMTVNRWVKGHRGVNPLAIATLRLYAMLPASARKRLAS